jgi:hypothetical protein
MTDKMTAEQALEWLRTIASISGAVASDRPLSFSYQEAVKFQAAVKALTAPRVPDGETVTFWVVYDTTTDKKYIKKNADTGALAMFDYEREARAVSLAHPGTGYKQVTYIKPAAAPAPADSELARLRERVKELESQLEPDMFWWADDPEHAAAYDLEGLCDQIFDNNLTPSDGIQLANVRLAASLPDAVLEAKVVERDGDFYWEARLRGGSDTTGADQ